MGWLLTTKFSGMLLVTTAISAGTLPISAGTYVLDGVPCKDPPLAAVMVFDGNAFVYPHASGCDDRVASRSGNLYHLTETCSRLGDGGRARSSRLDYALRLLAPFNFVVTKHVNGKMSKLNYRRCGR